MGTDAQSAAMAAVLVVLSASLMITMAVVDENGAAVRLGVGSDGGAPPENGRGCGAILRRGKSLIEAKSILEFFEQVVTPVLSAPTVLRRLFIADLLSWMAIMAYHMYWYDQSIVFIRTTYVKSFRIIKSLKVKVY